MQPLLGCYQPRALELLAGPAREGTGRLMDAVAAIEPVRLEVDDPEELFDVDSPDDLLLATAMLDRRRAETLPPY
jgi:molybdopterin-guanine dinucleotide biosynthesis protein A